MRILVITKFYHPRTGGVETTVKNICEDLVRMGHQCTVVAMDNELSGREIINGVEVIRFAVDTKALAGLNRGVWKYLTTEVDASSYDIVNIHQYHILLSMEAALFCKLRGIPYVFTAHYHGKGHTPLRNALFRIYHIMGKYVLSGSSRIICVSEYEKAKILRDFKGLENKCVAISAGIKEFPVVEVQRRRDSILYVGRLMRYKGIDYALMALKILKDRGVCVQLRIVGNGPDRGNLERIAADLGISDRVVWLGDISEEELNIEYRTAALLILLSAAEAYGLVVAEALSCDTPCIVADKEALTEFLSEPGVLGVRYPPDPQEVADLIARVIEGDGMKVGPLSSKIIKWHEVSGRYLDVLGEGIETVRSPASNDRQ